MSSKFRLAIAGSGLITRSSHLPAALALDAVELVGLVDPVVERARQLATEYGLRVKTAGDIGELFGEVDGVLVATPNHTHADVACRCLRAGIGTLIEKPLATSVAEGEAILEAAALSGAVVAVGYVTRFRESTVFLKELLDDCAFGSVRRFVHQFGTAGGWAPLSAYNLNASAAGGGVLVVTGTHFLDRMLHYWGMPDEVALESDARGGPEANCMAGFGFARGDGEIRGAAIYSKTLRLPGGLVVQTDRGHLRLADSETADIEWFPSDAPSRMEIVRRHGPARFPLDADSFALQIEDFVEAVRGTRAPMVSGSQGLASLALIERLYATLRPMAVDWYASAATAIRAAA